MAQVRVNAECPCGRLIDNRMNDPKSGSTIYNVPYEVDTRAKQQNPENWTRKIQRSIINPV